jgi:hypothetical protein
MEVLWPVETAAAARCSPPAIQVRDQALLNLAGSSYAHFRPAWRNRRTLSADANRAFARRDHQRRPIFASGRANIERRHGEKSSRTSIAPRR